MFPIRDDNPALPDAVRHVRPDRRQRARVGAAAGAGTEPALSSSVCDLGLIPGELLQTAPPARAFRSGPTAVCVVGECARGTRR